MDIDAGRVSTQSNVDAGVMGQQTGRLRNSLRDSTTLELTRWVNRVVVQDSNLFQRNKDSLGA